MRRNCNSHQTDLIPDSLTFNYIVGLTLQNTAPCFSRALVWWAEQIISRLSGDLSEDKCHYLKMTWFTGSHHCAEGQGLSFESRATWLFFFFKSWTSSSPTGYNIQSIWKGIRLDVSWYGSDWDIFSFTSLAVTGLNRLRWYQDRLWLLNNIVTWAANTWHISQQIQF